MSGAISRSGLAVLVLLSITFLTFVQARGAQDMPPAERLLNMPLAKGSPLRVLLVAPHHPKASIIMLPGGAGDVGLTRNGQIRHDNNFVVRTRKLWISRGYAVLIPDTIDHANLRGLRSSSQYALLVDHLIGLAHEENAAPVFLLGTSQGSIAAMHGAAHARPGSLAGVILTEPVSIKGASHETVFDAYPRRVRVPALVVANSHDRCKITPPAMAPKIAAAMINSPDVKILTVSGGIARAHRGCSSLSPHGYYGLESQVVGLINNWIVGRLSR